MSDEQAIERFAQAVDRAQTIINGLLMKQSAREALIELVGSETVAQFLIDVERGNESDALHKAALEKAMKEIGDK